MTKRAHPGPLNAVQTRCETSQKAWQRPVQEALDSSGVADREGLDSEFMDWCAEQVRGEDIISLDEAHGILSRCSGSLAHDIIDDRSDR